MGVTRFVNGAIERMHASWWMFTHVMKSPSTGNLQENVSLNASLVNFSDCQPKYSLYGRATYIQQREPNNVQGKTNIAGGNGKRETNKHTLKCRSAYTRIHLSVCPSAVMFYLARDWFHVIDCRRRIRLLNYNSVWDFCVSCASFAVSGSSW